MNLTTEQLGRLLCLMRDTEIKKDLIKTNLIENNEDIFEYVVPDKSLRHKLGEPRWIIITSLDFSNI